MKTIGLISRSILGLVFIYSGFIKGIDPLGLTYKIEEYFIAYHLMWLIPFALIFSILLCTLEFILGINLVMNIKAKYTSSITLIVLSFFTILTFFAALNNNISDCGCFGDAIHLTNKQTFYKNLVLLSLGIYIFIQKNNYITSFSHKIEKIIIITSGLFILSISIYSYRHLPLIDFSPWKVGAKIGEKIFAQHEIFDIDGKNQYDKIISNPNFQFVLISYDINKANKKSFKKINQLRKFIEKKGYSIVAICGSSFENIDIFRHETQSAFPFYQADETFLKEIIRSNPGLILLKNGRVIARWHYNDIPDINELNIKYLNKK